MCAPAIGSDDAREEERKPLSRGERVGEWLDLRNPSRVPLYESVRWAVVGGFFFVLQGGSDAWAAGILYMGFGGCCGPSGTFRLALGNR